MRIKKQWYCVTSSPCGHTSIQSGMPTSPRSDELGTACQLLTHHASDGDHREAAIVELLVLHLQQLRSVGWLEAQGVEAEVARCVVGLDGPQAVLRVLEGEDREDLEHGKRENHGEEGRLKGRLLEGDVGRHVDVATKERVELLADEEAERGKHRDAAMLDLCFPVEPDLALGDALLLAVAERVEETERTGDARHGLHNLERRGRRRLGRLDRSSLLHLDVHRRAHGEGSGREGDRRNGEGEHVYGSVEIMKSMPG